MPRTFYTIDDLFHFCKTNNFTKFNAKEHEDKPLIIQSFESFSVEADSNDGLLPVQLRACHIGKNRNRSSISKDVMEAHMASFKGRPILGAIHKTETGEYEFHAHDIQIVEDEDGESIEYIEQPVGVISEIKDPYLEYNKDEDKTYLMASGNIFEDYSHAAEILRRRKTCKCSVELAVNELTWDGQEECLSIEDFSFRGVTILGYEEDGVTEIEEGMKGSKITIDSFSAEQNSMFSANYQEKLLETLDRLNTTLSRFSINDATEKGVESENMNHFEELLEKYGITNEDINFEVEGLSDEELDAVFAEHFEEVEENVEENEPTEQLEQEEVEPTEEPVEEPAEETPAEEFVNDEPVQNQQYAVDENGNVTINYELSHDDIRCGLYNLLSAEGEYGWIIEVYNNSMIYSSWDEGKYYKRGYSVDGDNIALDAEKVEVFSEWLTQSEKDALVALKQSYAELKQFKDQYDADQTRAAKDAIFNRKEYTVLAKDLKFIELKNNAINYSIDEIEAKCKAIFADHVIANGKFALRNDESERTITNKVGLNFNKPEKKKAYGNLFKD